MVIWQIIATRTEETFSSRVPLIMHENVIDTEKDELKFVSKICGPNIEVIAITRPCIRFFLIQIAF